MQDELAQFGYAAAFIIGAVVFVAMGMLTSHLLAPHRPNPEKLASYECGEEPLGSSWVQFNMRFYVMGLVFLIFDVEVLLLFPWATVFADTVLIAQAPAWGWLALLEALVFIGILLLGLAYVWVRGDIDWVRPQSIAPTTTSPVPLASYAAFNAQQLGSNNNLPTEAGAQQV